MKPKYSIIYIDLKPDYAKLHNLPIKLPVLLEDFQKASKTNKLPLDIILRGLEAANEVSKDDYYKSYLVFYYFEAFKMNLEKDLPLAKKYLEKAKETSYDYRYHFYNALYLKKIKEVELSEFEFKQSISMNGNFAYSYYELGNLMFERKIYDEALEYYQKALDVNREFVLPNLKIADVYAENGRFTEALEYLKKCLDMDKNFIPAYQRIGVIFNQLQRFTDSVNFHEKALKIDSKNFELYYNYAYALAKLGRHRDAIKSLEKAVELNKKDFILHELSLEYKNIGEYILAFETEKEAFELATDKNKELIRITLLKLSTIMEDKELFFKLYNENEELKNNYKTFKMIFELSSGNIEEALKDLSFLNKEGLFLSLPYRLQNIEQFVETLEKNVNKSIEKSILESFNEEGILSPELLSEKLKENKFKGPHIGWLKEKNTDSKMIPNGLELITNSLLLSGFNYGLSERISTVLSRYLWKDGLGIAFGRILLRLYQDKIFGENSTTEDFVQNIIEEIKDLSFKFAKVLSEYDSYIMDFDTLLEIKIKNFEDALKVVISGMALNLSLQEILNSKFNDEKIKELLRFLVVIDF